MAQSYSPGGPIYGREYIFNIALRDQADTKKFKSNPTIASGDFKISKDNGSLANLNTLPAVSPASSIQVKIILSATEMEADNIALHCIDAAGSEWCDEFINIQTTYALLKGKVDDATFSPTSSAFECEDITEATANHFNGRTIIWISGNLRGQAATITDYELANSKGKFTVSTMTEAPSDGDLFIIV